MESFSLGVLDAVFKVIEERVPFGRALVTIASLLIVLSVIALCASYLIGGVILLFGRAPSIGFHPDWSRALSYLGWGVFWFVCAVFFVGGMIGQVQTKRREETENKLHAEREERIVNALEKLTQQGKLMD
jgi:hypothetical protein